ncbi:hypothetical protein CHUAL_003650 [Chamberlinius hualienensis]
MPTGYYSAAPQYFPQMIPMPLPPPPVPTAPPPSSAIKQEQMLTNQSDNHLPPHHSHSHTLDRHHLNLHCNSPVKGGGENGDLDTSSPSRNNSTAVLPPPQAPAALRPPLPPITMPGYYNNTNQASSAVDALSPSSKYKRKKKKKVKDEPNNQVANQIPPLPVSKKHMKQEKISESFKVRKKVDRFNGMPEEEVIKRTLPDHLAPDLDILIIGINPGLFAAFKGHHYAGPGNHFWKCLYLSGLIPDPMTADDDYKLIEFGIGFTNIVSRTTKGSADLNRKEIREGAQILQEKIQRCRPKIAVFNGKGIYEVFSGKKNFDFGKQPEPIEGTNSTIYVMPSSSARCAQLPRAVDKVPFYVALKKLRDHLCGRLPGLRESEVCFPDVKLKIESDDGLDGELLSEVEEPSASPRNGVVNLSANSDGTYSVNRAALPATQRNFHQHPLGRAALAAAAAAGEALDETLARAGLTRSGESLDGAKNGSVTRKYKYKKKKLKDDNEDDNCEMSDGVKKHRMEKDERQGLINENEIKHEQDHQQNTQQNQQQFADDYHRLQTQIGGGHNAAGVSGGLCPPPPSIQRPNPQGPSGTSSYGVSYPTQFPPSPSSDHSPLYGSPLGPSPYQHPPHIKQEKMDLLDPIRVNSPTSSTASAASASLLNPYTSSVGCLYGPPSTGYGPPQPHYYGATTSSSPYGAYHHHHHPSFGPPSPFSPQLSPMNPLNPLNQLSAGTSGQNSTNSTADLSGFNGFHHPTAKYPPPHHHHIPTQHQHQMASHSHDSTQYYSSMVAAVAAASLPTYHHPQLAQQSQSQQQQKDENTNNNSLTAPGAFHQYPSPPSSSPSPSPTTSAGSYNHLITHQHPMAHQYCPTAVENTTPGQTTNNSTGHNFDSSPPMYANLENVKVKQERMDSSYGEY